MAVDDGSCIRICAFGAQPGPGFGQARQPRARVVAEAGIWPGRDASRRHRKGFCTTPRLRAENPFRCNGLARCGGSPGGTYSGFSPVVWRRPDAAFGGPRIAMRQVLGVRRDGGIGGHDGPPAGFGSVPPGRGSAARRAPGWRGAGARALRMAVLIEASPRSSLGSGAGPRHDNDVHSCRTFEKYVAKMFTNSAVAGIRTTGRGILRPRPRAALAAMNGGGR